MDSFAHDLKFGFRQLRKSPVFTVVAILTLALGIGANATVFTWFNAIALNPLHGVPGHRDLITLRWRTPNGTQAGISWLDYLDYRNRNHTLKEFAVAAFTPLSLGEGTQPDRVWATLASANYFKMLDVKSELGRTFLPDEDENPGGHPVVVISNGLWQTKFGGERNIIGRQVLLNRRGFTVVGVMPEAFEGSVVGMRFDIWVPVMMADVLTNGDFGLAKRGVTWSAWFQARVKPGVDARAVTNDFNSIAAQLAHEFPATSSIALKLFRFQKTAAEECCYQLPSS